MLLSGAYGGVDCHDDLSDLFVDFFEWHLSWWWWSLWWYQMVLITKKKVVVVVDLVIAMIDLAHLVWWLLYLESRWRLWWWTSWPPIKCWASKSGGKGWSFLLHPAPSYSLILDMGKQIEAEISLEAQTAKFQTSTNTIAIAIQIVSSKNWRPRNLISLVAWM